LFQEGKAVRFPVRTTSFEKKKASGFGPAAKRKGTRDKDYNV
jgi:hypothetical protein